MLLCLYFLIEPEHIPLPVGFDPNKFSWVIVINDYSCLEFDEVSLTELKLIRVLWIVDLKYLKIFNYLKYLNYIVFLLHLNYNILMWNVHVLLKNIGSLWKKEIHDFPNLNICIKFDN